MVDVVQEKSRDGAGVLRASGLHHYFLSGSRVRIALALGFDGIVGCLVNHEYQTIPPICAIAIEHLVEEL
jgi:hypothetical protein